MIPESVPKSRWPYLLLLTLGAASVLLAAVDNFPRTNPHASFQRKESPLCPRCHFYSGGTRFEADRFAADADTLCYDCHAKEHLGRTHPVGSRPASKYGHKMNVPDEFPMNDDGKMMCLTCHFAHKKAYLSQEKSWPTQQPESNIPGRYYKTFYLRRTDPRTLGIAALCDGCHKKI
jgi:hypothetical protein